MTEKERYLRDIVDYLRHKEIEYRERNVLNENDKLGGFVYLQGMVQDGTISMEKALQIKPLLDDPYTDYEIEFLNQNKDDKVTKND